jgi:hypothetical protein
MAEPISDAVRRFVLTSIPTVPHMETLLLLWREPDFQWRVDEIAKRLFVRPAVAEALAKDLCRADLFVRDSDSKCYRCRRDPPGLATLLAAVDAAYNRHLREVTALIHANVDRKAARFAQAFTWEKK